MIAKFVLILTLSLCSLAHINAQSVDVVSLKSQLYADTEISPSETHNILKHLVEAGSFVDQEEASLMRFYLEAFDVSEEKCQVTGFLYLTNYLRDVDEEHVSLKRYLQDCLDRQFNVCKSIFAAKIESAAKQLTPDDHEKAVQLLNKVEEAQSGVETVLDGSDLSYTAMAMEAQIKYYEGILEFMELESAGKPFSELIHGDNGREKFNEQFDELVGDLCRRVTYALEPGMQIYHMIDPFEHLNPEADKQTLQWIQIDTICQEVLEPDTPYTVMDGVYQKLTQKY